MNELNERNITALIGILEQIKDAESDDYAVSDPYWMARCLAKAGVLVPASLTDDDCLDAVDAQTNIWEIVPRKPADFRETLDRIAKGGEKPVRERKACASLTSHEWEPTGTPGHYRCRLCPATQRRGDEMG